MAKPDLVFLTPNNDSQVRARLEPQVRHKIEIKEHEFREMERKREDAVRRIQQDAELKK